MQENPIPVYSPLFTCLYDEKKPIGSLGRGTHYSVFRCAEWFDVIRRPLPTAQIHDFSVIWDEDHDTRVIEAVERLYINSLFSPVQFIGERKGFLTIIVAAKYFFGDEKIIDDYRVAVGANIPTVQGDSWNIEIGSFDRSDPTAQMELCGIIAAKTNRVETYLRNIDSLWNLGTKEYQIPITKNPIITPKINWELG